MAKQQTTKQTWPIFLFTFGVFMAGLDNGIIGTALTTINESFGVSPDWGAWTITLYTLGIAISVPIVGKLSDRYGRRRLFIVEIALFGLGSILVALSPNFVFLLCARVIQAVGGGGIFIIGSSHILATLPKTQQGKALGLLGGMHGISAIIGPNLGAIILSLTGHWQWMFLINVPIVIFLITFGYLKIPESKPELTEPLDVRGIILLTIGILAMMFGITNIDHHALLESITKAQVIIFIVLGFISLRMFISYERQLESFAGDPIISYKLLKKEQFQLTLFLGFLAGGFIASIIFIPSYVQQVFLIPVEKAGFWVTPLALSSTVGAGLGGVLTDRIGATRSIMTSGFIACLGFVLFTFFVDTLLLFVIASIISGLGMGFLMGAPLNVLAGEVVGEQDKGTAVGTLSLSRQIGLTLFPTIFAGFIAKGFVQVEPTVQHVYESDLAIDVTAHTNEQEAYKAMIEQIDAIESPSLQTEILNLVSEIIKTGYNQMFLISVLLAIFVLIAGSLLNKSENNYK